MVHGECWNVTFGSSGSIAPVADALTRRGIATLNVQYRMLGDPGGGWPGTMRDVGAAIDDVRQIAKRYPIDPDIWWWLDISRCAARPLECNA